MPLMHRDDPQYQILRHLGRRVRELRNAKGQSQENLACDANIHRTYLSGVERGVRNPSLTTLARIASSLGVPIGSLVDQLDLDSDTEPQGHKDHGE